MSSASEEWGGSLHQTFRLMPEVTPSLPVFLNSDGLAPDAVLSQLPYAVARAGGRGTGQPDPKRYRDNRQVFQTVGLVAEHEGTLRVTEFGHATRRWLGLLTPGNAAVLGRHAAYGLAACQLRNPSRAGQAYASHVQVFPFSFIWRAMLALDNRISSAELNRALFRVTDEASLVESIQRIRDARTLEPIEAQELLGKETITGSAKNDRIISWVALASLGWLLIADKRETGSEWYSVRPSCLPIVREASQIRHRHIDFESMLGYVSHVSECASLPKDVR